MQALDTPLWRVYSSWLGALATGGLAMIITNFVKLMSPNLALVAPPVFGPITAGVALVAAIAILDAEEDGLFGKLAKGHYLSVGNQAHMEKLDSESAAAPATEKLILAQGICVATGYGIAFLSAVPG